MLPFHDEEILARPLKSGGLYLVTSLQLLLMYVKVTDHKLKLHPDRNVIVKLFN